MVEGPVSERLYDSIPRRFGAVYTAPKRPIYFGAPGERVYFFFSPSIAGRSLRELGFRATRRGRPVGLLSCCAALVIFCPSIAGRPLRGLGFRATRRGRPVGLLAAAQLWLTVNMVELLPNVPYK